MSRATAIRRILSLTVIVAALAACTAQEIAGTLQRSCRQASNCDDYTRRQP